MLSPFELLLRDIKKRAGGGQPRTTEFLTCRGSIGGLLVLSPERVTRAEHGGRIVITAILPQNDSSHRQSVSSNLPVLDDYCSIQGGW